MYQKNHNIEISFIFLVIVILFCSMLPSGHSGKDGNVIILKGPGMEALNILFDISSKGLRMPLQEILYLSETGSIMNILISIKQSHSWARGKLVP